ncbi:MAG TPA: NFACT RNA binding domain-containing protein [Nitratidesulfovibrio sp.]|nr:NFACT RNA binding domain-containing protein [Nitratidesulfovibrio sp.]
MDAHLFRRVCRALVPLLVGCRIEKIHAPAPDIHSLTIFAAGRKQLLVLRHGRRAPLLYLAAHKPPNPARPDAQVMLLRKHLAGRRVAWAGCDWPRRRLALRMAAPSGQANTLADEQGTLVLLDLREGMHMVDALPPDFGAEPAWPLLPPPSQPDALHAALRALCDGAATGTDPVLTPALRRTLTALLGGGQQDEQSGNAAPTPSNVTPSDHSAASLSAISSCPSPRISEDDVLDACALLVDLDSAEGDVFLYRTRSESCGEPVGPGEPDELSAWPLPAAQRGDRMEEVHESALEAAAILGEAAAFTGLADAARGAAAAPHKAEAKRLRRLLTKLDGEERRLRGLLDQRADAVALQAVLYRFAPDARLPEVTVDDGCEQCAAGDDAASPVAASAAAPLRTLRLDPLLTVRENMAAMFHRSDRGARGLAILERRRAEVARDLAAAEQAAAMPPGGDLPPTQARFTPPSAPSSRKGKGAVGKGAQARAAGTGSNVQRFRSSDGFLLLRGRCAEGNAELLRIASPFDWWLHAEDGPSAHLIIRRDHPAHQVPDRTMAEAASLVAVKSWQRNAAHARIMVALVRDVHAVKGAAPGAVRVDAVAFSLTVPPDAALEDALRLDAAQASPSGGVASGNAGRAAADKASGKQSGKPVGNASGGRVPGARRKRR